MRVELHSHTNYSDGLPSPEKLIRKADSFLDAIAITDHNTFSGYEKAKKIRKDILLIPGIEVSAAHGDKTGHILVLGSEELKFKKAMDALELIDNAHSAGALAIVAHPFGGFFRPGFTEKSAVKRFDAVEVINGMTFSPLNKKASVLAKKLRMKTTIGSDAHTLGMVGKYSCSIKGNSIDDILKSIKKGKIEFQESGTNPFYILSTQITRKFYIKFGLYR